MQHKKDIETVEDIKLMVDSFYSRVKDDELLAPIFFARIPADWQPHMEKMYKFWNAALLGIPGYKGAPFVPHATMPINEEHFNKWLALFEQTLDEHFEGPVAVNALLRAETIAKLFLHRLQDYQAKSIQIPVV